MDPNQKKPVGSAWPQRITAEDLREPERIERLYRAAVSRGWIAAGEVLRLAAYTLARHCVMTGKNPGGMFSANLRCGRWYGTAVDEEWARSAIASLDRERGAAEHAAGIGDCPEDVLPASYDAEQERKRRDLAVLYTTFREG